MKKNCEKLLMPSFSHNLLIKIKEHFLKITSFHLVSYSPHPLKYNISYASRKDLINFDNNTASCNNHIIPGLASLIGQKGGYIGMLHLFMQKCQRRLSLS